MVMKNEVINYVLNRGLKNAWGDWCEYRKLQKKNNIVLDKFENLFYENLVNAREKDGIRAYDRCCTRVTNGGFFVEHKYCANFDMHKPCERAKCPFAADNNKYFKMQNVYLKQRQELQDFWKNKIAQYTK